MASLPGFAEIVHQHQSLVYSLAYHSLGNRAVAEELTQDVFLSLHQNLHQLESMEHVKHWLRRAAAHRCIDEVRRQKFRRGPGLYEVPEPATRDRWQDPLLSRQLADSVASLPATARVVTVLRYQEELEPQEIAAVLRLPVATVKSRLHRALAMLRAKMQRKESVCKTSKHS
ncbi:MAG: RNA polymerase sigma factor [Bryobacteraceae bacterium]|nr:RNA polymerase sigma factor [Bryobacteraceae bacterium]